jgi:hypothetical protein
MAKKTERQWLADWQSFKDNHLKGSPVDLSETPSQKAKRIKDLESNFEQWCQYYFPKYYQSEPAPFHIASSKRILNNPEWYEVRSWSRELAKSTRTMMEILYLALTGKKKNIILVSNSFDNAQRLLLPYKIELESNERITNDYGEQTRLGQWEAHEFVTRKGVSFRALGKGQSPRGSRNQEARIDVLLLDDFDTDEECRNQDRVAEGIKWVEKALIPTRSISSPLLFLVCGNIIANYCTVTELAKKADKHDIINIRDQQGKSTWPQKNTEAHIDRVLSAISYNSAQQEYYNNPVIEGNVFKELYFSQVPALQSCDAVVVYSDPATSNKDRASAKNKSASTKGAIVVGRKGLKYYVYRAWLDTVGNSKFIDFLFEAHQYLKAQKVDVYKIYIENNSLQDPFYEQVLYPLIREKASQLGEMIPISPDSRKKADKYFRIEGTLEPINRLGNLIFNEKEKNNPHMQRLESQMLGVSEKAKMMDGPDMLEGGIWILQRRTLMAKNPYVVGKRPNRKY